MKTQQSTHIIRYEVHKRIINERINMQNTSEYQIYKRNWHQKQKQYVDIAMKKQFKYNLYRKPTATSHIIP